MPYNMMRYFAIVPLLAVTGSAGPIAQRAEDLWQVTRFSAYVAAHSITQMYAGR